MKFKMMVLLLSALILQAVNVSAAEIVKAGYDKNSKPVSSTTTDSGDAEQAMKDIKRTEAKPPLTGTGLIPTAEGNRLPGTTVTPTGTPLPPNVAVNRGVCPPEYRCVVPQGSMVFATCLLRTGNPDESSTCSDIQPRCAENAEIRRNGGSLGSIEGPFYDHNCKANF